MSSFITLQSSFIGLQSRFTAFFTPHSSVFSLHSSAHRSSATLRCTLHSLLFSLHSSAFSHALVHSSLIILHSSVFSEETRSHAPSKTYKRESAAAARYRDIETSESDLDAVGIAPAIGPRPGFWLGTGVRFNCGVLPKYFGYCQWRSP